MKNLKTLGIIGILIIIAFAYISVSKVPELANFPNPTPTLTITLTPTAKITPTPLPVDCSDSDKSSFFPDGKDFYTCGYTIQRIGNDLFFYSDEKRELNSISETYCEGKESKSITKDCSSLNKEEIKGETKFQHKYIAVEGKINDRKSARCYKWCLINYRKIGDKWQQYKATTFYFADADNYCNFADGVVRERKCSEDKRKIMIPECSVDVKKDENAGYSTFDCKDNEECQVIDSIAQCILKIKSTPTPFPTTTPSA